MGGPVWHASTASHLAVHATLARMARRALRDVGDADFGEWHHWTGRAYHLRRRLSADEAARVGTVRDIRGTTEARDRLNALGDIIDLDLIPMQTVRMEAGL